MKYLPLLLIVYSITASGQMLESKLSKKNSIHTTGSISFWDIASPTGSASATVSYERVLFKDTLSRHSLFIKGELGVVGSFSGEEGSIIGTQVGYLYGPPRKDNEYFEISIGFYKLKSSAYGNDGEISFRPTGLIGYRSHKSGGWFIFRYGFSYPLGIYFSAGAAF